MCRRGGEYCTVASLLLLFFDRVHPPRRRGFVSNLCHVVRAMRPSIAHGIIISYIDRCRIVFIPPSPHLSIATSTSLLSSTWHLFVSSSSSSSSNFCFHSLEQVVVGRASVPVFFLFSSDFYLLPLFSLPSEFICASLLLALEQD